MSADPRRVKELFVAALDLPDDPARRALLDHECGGDAELRRRLDVLLAAHDRPDAALGQPLAAPPDAAGAVTRSLPPGGESTADGVPDAAASAGTVVAGRYKLLECIGEGGMGTVWMAEQREPVKRLVALKLIKPGMDSRGVLARFEAERQALALMDHPNIAKVLDGGTTAEGRPYFVMELVKGLPLTEYCDARRLSVRDRLELFGRICSAVQHAHQKGVIHRDLKPANVLVTEHDGKPVPKVIDFGLAKALAASSVLTDKTLHTAFGAVVGTPLYMAPEQVGINALDVDTRTDVYALGVILYELLTGTTPLEKKQLREAAWDEMRRLIREEEPPRPSVRLSSSAALPSLAAGRQVEPARLTKLVRGELDWIVMKALEKDRNRRYETANGLAMDVQRHLAGEPVLAVPPSAGYRLRKFARKYRAGLTTAAAIALLLVAGVAVSSWQAVRATKAEAAARAAEQDALQAQRAETERAEGERLAKLDAQAQKASAEKAAAAEKAANAQAQKRLKQIEKANDLLGSIFENLDPREIARTERPLQAILVEKLDQAVAQLEGESIGDPLVVAAMQVKFGSSLLGLGEPGKAIVLLEKARATRQAKLGPEHPLTLESMSNLASAYHAAGKRDLALSLDEETLKLTKARLGPDDANTLVCMNNLAVAYKDAGKLDLALPLHEETLKLRKAKFGPDHPDTLESMGNLALAYKDAGKLDLALPLYEETLKLRKANLGPDHPDTLNCMSNLAVAYLAAGKLDLALSLDEETLKLRKARLGPEHPDTLTSMNNLAGAYQDAGKRDLALPLYEETLKLSKVRLGSDHPHTLNCMSNLAVAYQAAGKWDLALPLYEETLKLRKVRLGPDHPHTLTSMNNLAGAYWAAGKLDLALPLLEETLKLSKAILGPDDARTLNNMGNLGVVYCDANQGEKAAATFKEFVAGQRKRSKPDDPRFAGRLAQVAHDLLKCRQHAAAEEFLRECLAIREKTQPDAWNTFNTKSLLGAALLGQKKYADAGPLLLAGYEGMKQREKTIPAQANTRIPEATERLIELYTATNKPDEAEKWQAERAKYPNIAPPPREKK